MTLFSDAIRMIRDLNDRSWFFKIWGPLLNAPLLLGAVLFSDRPFAIALALVNIACLLIAGRIHRGEPFSRLTSLCHLLWLPLLPWLYAELGAELASEGATSAYGGWLAAIAVLMGVCLALDAASLLKLALQGDRRMMEPGGDR